MHNQRDGAERRCGDDAVLHVSVDEPDAGAVVVSLGGELDLRTSDGIAACLTELVTGNDVVVDLTGLRFVDAAGIGALVGARVEADERGRTITLRHPAEKVATMLRLTELDKVFPIEV
jgi:anti-sigma B factor antagonist